MSNEKTLQQQLAENRAMGQVYSSTKMLFPPPPLPAWHALRIDRLVQILVVSLVLYCASLTLFWSHIAGELSFSTQVTKALAFAAALNFVVMISSACQIQHRLHVTGVEKTGWVPVLFLALFLNPFLAGWAVPVWVLARVSAARGRLRKAPHPGV
jgi:hypothetical protein